MHIFYTNNIIKRILKSRSIGGRPALPEGPPNLGGGGRLTLKLVRGGPQEQAFPSAKYLLHGSSLPLCLSPCEWHGQRSCMCRSACVWRQVVSSVHKCVFGVGSWSLRVCHRSGEVLRSVSSEWGGPYECAFGVGRSLWVCHRSGEVLTSESSEWGGPYECVFGVGRSFQVQRETRGVSHYGLCAFALKSILRRQKKNYGNSNISPCQNLIFKKSSKKETKILQDIRTLL